MNYKLEPTRKTRFHEVPDKALKDLPRVERQCVLPSQCIDSLPLFCPALFLHVEHLSSLGCDGFLTVQNVRLREKSLALRFRRLAGGFVRFNVFSHCYCCPKARVP